MLEDATTASAVPVGRLRFDDAISYSNDAAITDLVLAVQLRYASQLPGPRSNAACCRELCSLEKTMHWAFTKATGMAGCHRYVTQWVAANVCGWWCREHSLDVSLRYAADLFDASTMERMGQHFSQLLAAALAAPDTSLSKLALMGAEERQLVLRDFNNSAAPFPADATVHQLFEQHAASSPDTVCLVYGAARLNYKAVNEAANQLAHWLVGHGIGAGTAVSVSSHKCPELYITLLAVLKAGAAYVPLDPALPAERAAYMVQQTGVRLLLTAAGNELAQLPGVEAVVIDQGWQQFASESVLNLPQHASSGDVAYCIFTSGSTGQPKVMRCT